MHSRLEPPQVEQREVRRSGINHRHYDQHLRSSTSPEDCKSLKELTETETQKWRKCVPARVAFRQF